MPAQRRSLAVTDAYRSRLLAIRSRVEREAARRFPSIDQLDATDFPERMAAVLSQAQAEAVRVTAGYLAAFLSSELGQRTRPVSVSSRDFVGLSRDGRPLEEALRSPLIGVKAKLAEGAEFEVAVAVGRNRAARMAEVDLMHAARAALEDAIERDDRLEGWERATAGTCGACAALSGTSGPHFQVHPNCQCVSQPVVRGVSNRFPLPTGAEIFQRLTREEQDAQYGAEKADALRKGDIQVADLVATTELASDQQNFVTEASLADAS